MARKTTVGPEAAQEAAGAFDGWADLEPVKIHQLQPGAKVEDIPEGIRNLIEKAYADNSPYSITLPNGIAVESFLKLARTYCHIRPDGKLVFRAKVDGDSVNYSARVNNTPVAS